MRKVKNRHVFLLIMLGLVVALILRHYGVFTGSVSPLASVPIDCAINDYCHESASSSYTCPSEENGLPVSKCQIKGIAECNDPKNPAKVIYRAGNGWIAWDYDNNNALECFVKATVPQAYCNIPSIASIIVTKGKYTGNIFNTNGMYMFIKHLEDSNNYCAVKTDFYSIKDSSYCESSNIPQVGYENEELTSGTQNVFTCNSHFTVFGTSGNVIYDPETFQYSSSVAGSKTALREMNPGESVEVTGGDVNHVYYSNLQEVTSCTLNACNPDNTGYNVCKNGAVDMNDFIPCDVDNLEVCKLGTCTFPIDYETKIVSPNDIYTSKSGFGPSDLISFRLKMSSQNAGITSGTVHVLLYQYGSDTAMRDYPMNWNFKDLSTKSIAIDNPGIGALNQQFYIVVRITINGKTKELGRNQEFSFRIAQSLGCNYDFQSNINGQTRSTLYVNYPVKLNIISTEAGLPSTPDNINLDIKLNSNGNIIPITQITKISDGIYQFTPTSVGVIDAIVSVVKSGVETTCLSAGSPRVDQLSVTPKFTDINLYTYRCAKQGDSVTLHIQTKDSLGNLVDAPNMELKAVESQSTLEKDITNLLSGSDGDYSFIYNFPTVGNTYFKISSDYFNPGNCPTCTTGGVSVEADCTKPECVQNSDCNSKGTGYTCVNNICQNNNGPNWLLYVGIGFAVLVVLIIIVFIFKFKRNPTQGVSTGLEGL